MSQANVLTGGHRLAASPSSGFAVCAENRRDAVDRRIAQPGQVFSDRPVAPRCPEAGRSSRRAATGSPLAGRTPASLPGTVLQKRRLDLCLGLCLALMKW